MCLLTIDYFTMWAGLFLCLNSGAVNRRRDALRFFKHPGEIAGVWKADVERDVFNGNRGFLQKLFGVCHASADNIIGYRAVEFLFECACQIGLVQIKGLADALRGDRFHIVLFDVKGNAPGQILIRRLQGDLVGKAFPDAGEIFKIELKNPPHREEMAATEKRKLLI